MVEVMAVPSRESTQGNLIMSGPSCVPDAAAGQQQGSRHPDAYQIFKCIMLGAHFATPWIFMENTSCLPSNSPERYQQWQCFAADNGYTIQTGNARSGINDQVQVGGGPQASSQRMATGTGAADEPASRVGAASAPQDGSSPNH